MLRPNSLAGLHSRREGSEGWGWLPGLTLHYLIHLGVAHTLPQHVLVADSLCVCDKLVLSVSCVVCMGGSICFHGVLV